MVGFTSYIKYQMYMHQLASRIKQAVTTYNKIK